MGWKGVELLYVTQQSEKWTAVVNTTVDLRVLRNVEIL
jgi:hypothetical protein